MSRYSLSDLSGLVDVTPRTVRYYIAQGLLQSPDGSGPGARYGDGHLHRLRMIRRLQRDHLPLAEIRKRLALLSDEHVASLLTEEVPVRESAADYIAALMRDRETSGPASFAAPRRWAMLPTPMALRADSDARESAVGTAALRQPAPDRSQWDRIALAPDIELHVRRPLTRDQNRTVDRIVAIAQQLLKEDPR